MLLTPYSYSQDIQKDKRIDSLNAKAWSVFNQDLEAFRNLGEQALEESNSKGYLFGQCEAFQILGTYFFRKHALDTSLTIYNQALAKREQLGDSAMISGTLNNIANIHRKKGFYTKALEQYRKAKSYIPSHNFSKKARLYINISAVQAALGNYPEALRSNQNSLDILQKLPDVTTTIASCKVNRGNIYETLKDFRRATIYYQEAYNTYHNQKNTFGLAQVNNNLGNVFVKTNKIDSSILFYERAKIAFDSLGMTSNSAGVLQNLGTSAEARGDFISAKSYYQQSLDHWLALQNSEKQAEVLTNIGYLNLEENDSQTAITKFRKAEELGPQNKQLFLQILNGLKLALAKEDRHAEAFAFQQQHDALSESLNQELVSWRNLEFQLIEEKGKLDVLQKEKEANMEILQKEKFLRIALIAGIVSLIAFFIMAYFNWLAKRKRLIAENIALEKQRGIENLLKTQELVSIRNVLEVQEKERKRIAQDLHDRLGSMLSMVKLHFQSVNKNIEVLKKKNHKEYKKVNDLLDEACEEVRKISHNLMSGVLKNFGLVAAIEELCQSLRNTEKYEVEFVADNFKERLSADKETAIYRIIQELISNILRHAEANEISIQILKKVKIMQIIVEDDGKGFVPNANVKGMGLKSIASRVDGLEGKLNIDSHNGRGTTVILEIPLKQKL